MGDRLHTLYMVPAIPPEDYSGSIADWIVGLRELTGWDGTGYYGDIEINNMQWSELVERCEEERR